MLSLFFTQEAREDLSGIADFIAQQNPEYANRVLSLIASSIANLCVFPKMGRCISKPKNIHFFVEPSF